ncbi:MAG: YbdK family carboxylate-amine ligase, partial [Anaerolineales bacterium]|nr:YbdK family carboxylate-amine ligase [Anaerolineales bacterium]
RYSKLLDDFRSVAQQLLVFGMHIHVGFGKGRKNQDIMIEIMNQMRYFLPHILALSSSSPFWQGRNTGLMSYRSVVFEMMPRSGIPPSFQSHGEYEQYVDILGQVGSLEQGDNNKYDATKIWWDIRPHPIFGTLEIRIADICTDINDTIAIAALIQAIIATLLKLRSNNQSWRTYRQYHITENKWRAVRYGTQGKLIDFGIGQQVAFSRLVQEILEIVDPVLDELNSRKEVQHIQQIVQQGTSAKQQIDVYEQALKQNNTNHDAALYNVVDYLANKTVSGL